MEFWELDWICQLKRQILNETLDENMQSYKNLLKAVQCFNFNFVKIYNNFPQF